MHHMSTSQLSRRFFVASAAALPTLAVPAAAVAAAAIPMPPEITEAKCTLGAPTPIAELWRKRQAALREYNRAAKLCEKLENTLKEQMPDPDPSIVWGHPDNDADGLKYWVDGREPIYFKRYIFSGWIEGKLESARKPITSRSKFEEYPDGSFALISNKSPSEQEPFPFTSEELALQDRLAKRLELSRSYESEMERVSRKIGLTAAERWRDDACDRQCKFEWKILAAPVESYGDLAIKLKIYRFHQEEIGGDDIVRDVKRLVRRKPASEALAA
jgi:hypothetical protein